RFSRDWSSDVCSSDLISRDLALIKVKASEGESRVHVMQLVEVYRARIVDVAPESLIVEATGPEAKIDSLIDVLRPYGVLELVRRSEERRVGRGGRSRW